MFPIGLFEIGSAAVLGALAFVAAFLLMHDVGFVPRKSASVTKEMRHILKASWDHGGTGGLVTHKPRRLDPKVNGDR